MASAACRQLTERDRCWVLGVRIHRQSVHKNGYGICISKALTECATKAL